MGTFHSFSQNYNYYNFIDFFKEIQQAKKTALTKMQAVFKFNVNKEISQLLVKMISLHI